MAAVRQRARTDLSVSQLTLSELQAELQRRIRVLQKKRESLLADLEVVERDLKTVSNGLDLNNDRPSTKRMSADDYQAAVPAALKLGKLYTTTEMHQALVDAGYNAKKNTLSQGMAAWLVDVGVLVRKGKKGKANLHALAN